MTGSTLEPLSRRLLQAAGALSLLLIVVVANSLLNSGSASPFNPNPVAAAAERTQEAPGMRFSMTAVYSSESQPRTVAHGGGAYSSDSGLVQVRMRAPTPQGQTVGVEVVGDDSSMYLRSPEFAGRLPEGKEWLEVDPELGRRDESTMAGESFDSSLRMLAASGGVRRVGHARIRGARTTRYRVTVEAPELADVLGPISAEAFVDDHGMLRRVRTVITTATDGAPVTMDMRIDLFDFGAEPDIQPPDESLVFDMTPILEEQLDALGSPADPPSPEPVSEPALAGADDVASPGPDRVLAGAAVDAVAATAAADAVVAFAGTDLVGAGEAADAVAAGGADDAVGGGVAGEQDRAVRGDGAAQPPAVVEVDRGGGEGVVNDAGLRQAGGEAVAALRPRRQESEAQGRHLRQQARVDGRFRAGGDVGDGQAQRRAEGAALGARPAAQVPRTQPQRAGVAAVVDRHRPLHLSPRRQRRGAEDRRVTAGGRHAHLPARGRGQGMARRPPLLIRSPSERRHYQRKSQSQTSRHDRRPRASLSPAPI